MHAKDSGPPVEWSRGKNHLREGSVLLNENAESIVVEDSYQSMLKAGISKPEAGLAAEK